MAGAAMDRRRFLLGLAAVGAVPLSGVLPSAGRGTARRGHRRRVIVLGAGLAGLATGYASSSSAST
jgi:hypothetical protein